MNDIYFIIFGVYLALSLVTLYLVSCCVFDLYTSQIPSTMIAKMSIRGNFAQKRPVEPNVQYSNPGTMLGILMVMCRKIT